MTTLVLTAEKFARITRYVVAAVSVSLSGWFLLETYFLRDLARAKLECWNCMGPLPSHLALRTTSSLLSAIALPFLAAWLMPSTTKDPTKPLYFLAELLRSYPRRLIFSLLCALLVAIGLVAIEMILLDSGIG